VPDIPAKVVELATAKVKELPIIIFCSNIEQYLELLP
jgi:hypothetical protein